jgi:hypothetical protein
MPEAYVRDFDAEIDGKGRVRSREEKCRVKFEKHKLPNGSLIDIAKIFVPGDKTQVAAQRVDDNLKRRFPEEWLRYTKGDVAAPNGTPLSQLPTLSQGIALQMQATGITSVEDLANMTDVIAKSFMGGLGWRKKAIEFLANKRPDESEALKSEVAELKDMVAKLLAAQTEKPAKKDKAA